jgi:hypothetical protein
MEPIPAFLTRRGDGAAATEIEPCDQIAVALGVAGAALSLAFVALWTVVKLSALHGLQCCLRRAMASVGPASVNARLVTTATSFAVGLNAGIAMFF